MSPTSLPEPRPLLSGPWQRTLLFVTAAGFGAALLGLVHSPERSLSALLAAAVLLITASLGGLAWLALFHVANAGFFVAFKRVLEGLALLVPLGGGLLLLLLPGAPTLYGWVHSSASDAVVHGRGAFQSLPAFALRMVLALALWTFFALALRRESRRQDLDGDLAHTRRSVALSAVFLLLGGYTISLAGMDWLMSADPHWASTIYGFYTIGGVLQTGAAVTALVVLALRRAGRLPEVNHSHLHDLGKMLFAFSTFWAYLWFSQYLLIWYANLPEETAWILARTRGGWAPVFYGNLVINWVAPFLLLLPRPAKQAPVHLARVASLVVVGRFVDLWLQVAPARQPEVPLLPWVELGALLGATALFVLVLARVLASAPLLARQDPYLDEALHHHT
ncbi:MAG: hypothetical protein JST92_24670 [Deltaproteobacteria bacterium]|nr:hypothetical protein [Deltaproteobacteria bacterium]